MPTNPLKIGLTGGIGSGKSIVCEIFNTLDIPVYNADDRAKNLMIEDPDIGLAVKQKFGGNAYFSNGRLNREFLAKTVFKNRNRLEELNSIVHPAVALDFEKWIVDHGNYQYLVKEAALLVESGSYKALDYLIVVTAPIDLRIKRVVSRDKHRSRKDVESIISKQLSEGELIEKSQFVIANNGDSLLIPQVLKIHEFFISLKQTG